MRTARQGIVWKMIRISGVTDEAVAHFTDQFNRQLIDTGVCQANRAQSLGSPIVMSSSPSDEEMASAFEELRSADKRMPDLVVLMLERKHQGIYSMFTYHADKLSFIPSICVTEASFRPKPSKTDDEDEYPTGWTTGWEKTESMRQYTANVAMKANLKYKGVNHEVEDVSECKWMKDTMVIGGQSYPCKQSPAY